MGANLLAEKAPGKIRSVPEEPVGLIDESSGAIAQFAANEEPDKRPERPNRDL